MATIIVIGIIVILLLYIVGVYNGLVKLSNKEKEAFATMDVYLKKRWDLVPNLVETVKGYAKHEQETLENVIKLRNTAYDTMSSDDKIDVNTQLTKGVSQIMMLAESYPDLKANENFKELSKELSSIENDIANARKYYNAVIRQFNDKVLMFPGNIFAGMFGYKEKRSFEIIEAERENVKVSF